MRWPVEENYKFLKQRVQLGNFTGKTTEAICQDFYAKVFIANLTSILVFNTSIEIEQKKQKCKRLYKINWNNAIQNMKRSGFLLFIRLNIKKILLELYELFKINLVSIRPERTYARKLYRGKNHYSICYK